MELLDDVLETGGSPTKENIKEIYKLRQEHSKTKRAITNARIALAVVCIISVFSLFVLLGQYSDPWVIGISVGVVAILIICAATPPKHAKISLSVAFALYMLNLAASIYQNPATAIYGVFIKGFFIFFIYVGMRAAFKHATILKKMERLNVTPYKD